MKRLPRSVVTSVLATASDFTFVWMLVGQLDAPAPLSTTLGAVVGGLVAFTLSRSWVFDAQEGARARQATRFVFVSGTSALLNGGGVALLLLLPSVDYRIAWAITRFVVFATWNYPLLRDYVFAPPLRVHSAPELVPTPQPTRS